MRRARLIPLLFSLVIAPQGMAQSRWTADAGLSQLRQSGLGESSAMTLGATYEYLGERVAARSTALGAVTGGGRGTGQWLGIATVLTPVWKGLSLQGTGSASAFGQSNLRPTSSLDVAATVVGAMRHLQFGVGGASGSTSHNAEWIPDRRAIGQLAWMGGVDRIALDASVTRTRAVFGESSILVDISRRESSYADGALSWLHEAGAWSTTVAAGMRGRRSSFSDSRRTWQSVDATVWIAPRMALVASAGSTLEDLVRGVPRAEYATLALRFSGRPHIAIGSRRGPSGPRLVPTSDRRLELLGVTAERVELMADFTSWNPVLLERNGPAWIYRGAVSSGLHRVAIRIDGGEWSAPPNLPKAEDELGGVVGLITVP